MGKKILWLGLCSLLVLSLILSSCTKIVTTTTTTQPTTTTTTQPTTTTTTQPTTTTSTTTTTTTASTPQYGGRFTFFGGKYGKADPASFDVVTTGSLSATDFYTNPYGESLLKGDINKYGPRGNNQFSFQYNLVSQFTDFYGPALATSWEVTNNPLGVIYQLRQGVMWTGNTNIGMGARELTADDVTFHLNRILNNSPIKSILTYIKSITATSKYTVTILWNNYYAQWQAPIGLDGGVQGRIQAPESVKAGASNWRNAVGTGPYILTDYVQGSSCTYRRNPNYWGTTTINGKEYQTPFIETISYPIIPDEATEVAALRTGKIDMWEMVPITYQSTLASTSPNLKITKWSTNTINVIKFNTLTSKYFSNKDIRRAMYVATDFKAISDSLFQGGDINSFPFAPGTPTYTPPDKMSASVQALYKYDPTTAKKMISDAGFPTGFTCTITIDSSPLARDIADTLASQWAKAGVTLQIQSLEATAYQAAYTKITYADMAIGTAIGSYSTDSAWAVLYAARTGSEGCAVNDPYFNGQYDKVQQIMNLVEVNAQIQQLGIYILDNAFFLPFCNPIVLSAYWPWIKNYYGELTAGNYNDIMPMVTQMWLDQNLKKSMGF